MVRNAEFVHFPIVFVGVQQMSNKVAAAPIRSQARSLLLTGVAFVALFAVILGPLAFETAIGHRESERQARRLAETLSIGDSKQQVEEVINRDEYDRLELVKFDNSSWQVLTPEVVGAWNWVISLDFEADRLSRVAVRIADSAKVSPAGAPPDKSLGAWPSNR